MYKIVITMNDQNKSRETYYCDDFKSTQDRILMDNVKPKTTKGENLMVIMLSSVGSFYVEDEED